MRHCVTTKLAWRDPIAVLKGWEDLEFSFGLISDGRGWSWLARDCDQVKIIRPGDPADPFQDLADLIGPATAPASALPFTGGVVGLAAYSLAGRIEALDLGDESDWPELIALRVSALLVFDHTRREIWAVGRGETEDGAENRAANAASWLSGPAGREFAGPLTEDIEADDPLAFEEAVARVRGRIAAGEVFQANIARRWRGRLKAGATPLDLAARLSQQSPAPYAAYLRAPGLALVSNSPEQFVQVSPGERTVLTRPIKGTAPRGADATEDEANKAALAASAKDRAENLMIVDLMRNDLSRVCEPGSVATPELFRLETFANVHHLVSTVTGRLKPDVSPADLLRAVFPPGSITGAPKVQAMKVIRELEPPRGPFFGALFWACFDGGFESSVLIRTTAFEEDPAGWSFEARAGGGITADSDPHAERLETEDKIAAILRALTEPQA